MQKSRAARDLMVSGLPASMSLRCVYQSAPSMSIASLQAPDSPVHGGGGNHRLHRLSEFSNSSANDRLRAIRSPPRTAPRPQALAPARTKQKDKERGGSASLIWCVVGCGLRRPVPRHGGGPPFRTVDTTTSRASFEHELNHPHPSGLLGGRQTSPRRAEASRQSGTVRSALR